MTTDFLMLYNARMRAEGLFRVMDDECENETAIYMLGTSWGYANIIVIVSKKHFDVSMRFLTPANVESAWQSIKARCAK